MWIFAVTLGWLPDLGTWQWLTHMILPAVCLGWFQVAAMMRLIRSSMLDVLDSEFVKLTRIKGLPEWKVVWKHCLRNAAIAPLTYFADHRRGVDYRLGGDRERLCLAWDRAAGSWMRSGPGISRWCRRSSSSLPPVFIMTNLVVDILYAYIDPRIRYS